MWKQPPARDRRCLCVVCSVGASPVFFLCDLTVQKPVALLHIPLADSTAKWGCISRLWWLQGSVWHCLSPQETWTHHHKENLIKCGRLCVTKHNWSGGISIHKGKSTILQLNLSIDKYGQMAFLSIFVEDLKKNMWVLGRQRQMDH